MSLSRFFITLNIRFYSVVSSVQLIVDSIDCQMQKCASKVRPIPSISIRSVSSTDNLPSIATFNLEFPRSREQRNPRSISSTIRWPRSTYTPLAPAPPPRPSPRNREDKEFVSTNTFLDIRFDSFLRFAFRARHLPTALKEDRPRRSRRSSRAVGLLINFPNAER